MIDLSIIIPVWNEEAKIATDILNIDRHFRQSALNVELIVVDDGSADQTIKIIKNTFNDISMKSQIIECKHKGKGHAVRQGMKDSEGKLTMFMDCGGNIPLDFIDKGIEIINTKSADMVLGTRYHPESTINLDRVWYRKITSSLFRNFTRFFLNLPAEISDSQCGFKIFNGDMARTIFNNLKSDGFLFDLEVILEARKHNYSLTDLPVIWRCDRDSRLSIIRSFGSVIKELLYLRKI